MAKYLANIPFKYRCEFKNKNSQLVIISDFNFILNKVGDDTPIINENYSVNNTFYDLDLTLNADSDKDITYYVGTFYSVLTEAKSIVFEIQKNNFIPLTEKCIREMLGVTEFELPDTAIDIGFQYSLLDEDQKYDISQGDPKSVRILKIKTALQSLPTLYNSLIKEESNGTNTRIRNSQSLKDLEISLRTELETLQARASCKKSAGYLFGSIDLCGFTGPKGFIANS